MLRNRHKLAILIAGLAFTPTFAAADGGGVFSSLEQYNHQTGDSELTLRSYDAFDELDGLPGVTSYTVAVNDDDPQTIDPNPEYDFDFKRRQSWDNLEDMLAARPIGATYTHELFGSPNGEVVIESPDVHYDDAIPVDPIFTISGATGDWAIDDEGHGIFYFDPTDVTELTITLNPYSLRAGASGTPGEYLLSALFVAYLNEGFDAIDAVDTDLLEPGDPLDPLSITFTKGLPLDGGDGDPTTYGFSPGDWFELEGEHVNIFGLGEADGFEDVYQGFVYQNVTSMVLAAQPIPEPTSLLLLGAGSLLLLRRRAGRQGCGSQL